MAADARRLPGAAAGVRRLGSVTARGRGPRGPILASSSLAGIAAILLAPETGRLLDESLVDDSIAVLTCSSSDGAIYGAFAYWIGGASSTSACAAPARREPTGAPGILAFAAVPTVVGLFLVWPVGLSSTERTRSARAGTTTASARSSSTWSRALRPLVARAAGLRDRGRRALAPAPRRRRGRPGGAAIFVLTFPFVLAASAG